MIKAFQNQKMSADVLEETNLDKKNEEALIEFKKDSKLKDFLFLKSGNKEDSFTFKQILKTLKDVVLTEELFDLRNPSVILCSSELEEALDRKALHVTEVRDLVISQVENSEEINYPEIIHKKSLVSPVKRFLGNLDTKFGLQPDFLQVVKSVEGADQTKSTFSVTEVLKLLSKYIISKRTTIVDPRNLKLALVENDPLGKAFKVAAFHRCQVR